MGLQTCAAPSAYSLHTIRHESKFIGFLCKHKENCARCVDRFFMFVNCTFVALMFVKRVLKLWFTIYSSHICGKLIYMVLGTNHMQTTQRD